MAALERLGGQSWFKLGDKDLATHVERTRRMCKPEGEPLSAIMADFCLRLGVRHKVVPMTDDPVRTLVETERGRRKLRPQGARSKLSEYSAETRPTPY